MLITVIMSLEPGLPIVDETMSEISVVYVDDYRELCELTAEGLEQANGRLTVETTTEPSIVADRLGEFDCIVADYDMPETDGIELLRRVRTVSEEIPFILYTGKGDEDIASEAISLGVTDYLAKRGGPERFVRLAHRIESIVDARRASAEAAATRTKARTAVEREQRRLRALLEHSSTVTCVLDESGRFRYLSPAIEDVTGFAPQELQGEPAFDYIHDDDRERAERAFSRLLDAPGETHTVEIRVGTRNGGQRHAEFRGTNHLEDPAVEGIVVNARDITERKRIDRRLRRERELIERLFEVTPAPLLLMDGDGRIRRLNDRATEVFDTERSTLQGHAPEESSVSFRGENGETIVDGEDLWEVVSHAKRAVHGAECEVSLPSGDYRLEVSAAPLPETGERFVVVAVETVQPAEAGADGNT
jgi:PAS domain S-box-containing protein